MINGKVCTIHVLRHSNISIICWHSFTTLHNVKVFKWDNYLLLRGKQCLMGGDEIFVFVYHSKHQDNSRIHDNRMH